MMRTNQKDTDIIVKAQQSSCEFSFTLHNDPNFRANTFVDQFLKTYSRN